MPSVEGKNGTEDEEMDQDTPESDKSDDDESDTSESCEESSGIFGLLISQLLSFNFFNQSSCIAHSW
jgi:hypothetical protein